jgi:cytochrome c2
MTKRAKHLALIGLLVVPIAAFRFGGWAIVTVHDVPEYAVAGTPVEFVYDVRQHGVTLRDDVEGSIEATLAGAKVGAGATSMGKGRYRATLTFPRAGTWKVRISSGWGPIGGEMEPLTVIAKGAATPAPMSPYNRGKQLFVAKGCVTCHSHQLTADYTHANVGPDLSEPKFMSAYLTKFLADPSIKTNWANSNRMPDLGLKPAEITALVAFLNRETKAAAK